MRTFLLGALVVFALAIGASLLVDFRHARCLHEGGTWSGATWYSAGTCETTTRP